MAPSRRRTPERRRATEGGATVTRTRTRTRTTRRQRRKLTPELEAEAVRLLRAGDRSLCQVAKDLDLSETSLRGWASQVDVGAGKGAHEALTTAEREELTKLRKQVKRLEMEREIPKRSGGVLREGERVTFSSFARRRPSSPSELSAVFSGLAQRILRVVETASRGTHHRRRATRDRDSRRASASSRHLRQSADPSGAAREGPSHRQEAR